jgi:hypothetical protein
MFGVLMLCEMVCMSCNRNYLSYLSCLDALKPCTRAMLEALNKGIE